MRGAALVALLLGALPLGGCVAAVAIPVLAGGAMVGKQITGKEEREVEHARPAPPKLKPKKAPAKAKGKTKSEAADGVPVPAGPAFQPLAAEEQPLPGTVQPGVQYLFGSGEAAGLSLQAYQGLTRYLKDRAYDRQQGRSIASLVLTKEASLTDPDFVPCENKPLAAVFDIDETVLLNLGYEYADALHGRPYDEARWQRWEVTGVGRAVAAPGAGEAIAAARRAGIEIIYISNRSTRNAASTAATLDDAGLGPVTLGNTLLLREEKATTGGKDARRWEAAEKYCVVALVGDQLGDFSDLFNAPDLPLPSRRSLAAAPALAPLWGSGWFILPNPAYGTALRGGIEEIFPANKRWDDPAEDAKQ